jgi:hypothetical protein
MENILKYKQCITVGLFSLTTKRYFVFFSWLWLMPITSLSHLMLVATAIFERSVLGKSLEADALNIPNSKPICNSEEPLSFVIVGDEAFPLKRYLLRSYPRVSTWNDESKKMYNYRLSRARRVVENAFGILTQHCRLFCGRIRVLQTQTK